jgi:hypothetical protein
MKRLKEITHFEWALYEWIDVTPPESTERMFVRGKERTPDDAVRAHGDYDSWVQILQASEK